MSAKNTHQPQTVGNHPPPGLIGADDISHLDTVAPFCFECLATDTKTTSFFLLACSKIVCERCRSRLVNPENGLVKCSAHKVFEKCLKLDNKMPNRLKSLFHNNDEEQLRAVAFHIQYVDKLHSELSSRLAKLPQQPSETEIQGLDTELNSILTEALPLPTETDDELTKLGRDLKSAEKVDAYFRDYERRLTEPSRTASQHHQRPSSSAVSDARYKTPNQNTQTSVSSILKTNPEGSRQTYTTNDSGYPISHQRSQGHQQQQQQQQQQRTNSIARSTPIPSGIIPMTTPATTSTQYSLFRRAIEQRQQSAATNKTMTTPIKSILKNSGSRQTNSTTTPYSRGISGLVLPSATQPKPAHHQPLPKTVPDFFRSRSNLMESDELESISTIDQPTKMRVNPPNPYRIEPSSHHHSHNPKPRIDFHNRVKPPNTTQRTTTTSARQPSALFDSHHLFQSRSTEQVHRTTSGRQSIAFAPRIANQIGPHQPPPANRFIAHPEIARKTTTNHPTQQQQQQQRQYIPSDRQTVPATHYSAIRNAPTMAATQLRHGTPHPRRDGQ